MRRYVIFGEPLGKGPDRPKAGAISAETGSQ
jgi:hypothetical protein